MRHIVRLLIVALFVLSLAGMLPLLAQSPESGCPANYAGLMLPRLTVGLPARVVDGGSPNRVRSQANTSAQQIGTIAPGTPINVLEGPACSGGIVWWLVSDGRITGWTAEGLDRTYFLEPASAAGFDQAATLAAQVTNVAVATQVANFATQNALATQNAIALAEATRSSEIFTATAISMEMTARASITPTATATITSTPTITPTLAPPSALPAERAVITRDNAARLVLLSTIPGAGGGNFSSDGSQILTGTGRVFALPEIVPVDEFMDFPLTLGTPIAFSDDRSCTLFRPAVGEGWAVYSASTGDVVRVEGMLLPAWAMDISNGPNCRVGTLNGEHYGNPEPPRLLIWSMATQRVMVDTPNDNQFAPALAFNRDGSFLAVNGTVRLVESGRAQWRVPGAGYYTNGGVAYRPVPANSGEQLAFGSSLLDLGRGTIRSYAITGGTTGWRFAFSPDGALIGMITTTDHGAFDAPAERFNLFDVESGLLLLDMDPPYDMAFSPDGTLMMLTDGGGNLLLYGLPAE